MVCDGSEITGIAIQNMTATTKIARIFTIFGCDDTPRRGISVFRAASEPWSKLNCLFKNAIFWTVECRFLFWNAQCVIPFSDMYLVL